MKHCLWNTATATKFHVAYSILNFKFIPKWFSDVILLSIFFSYYHSLMSFLTNAKIQNAVRN